MENKPMPPLTTELRNAARWLTHQPWKASPAHWVSQAQIRYQLTDQQASYILYSMRLQLGQN
jgi:hypothetical protein